MVPMIPTHGIIPLKKGSLKDSRSRGPRSPDRTSPMASMGQPKATQYGYITHEAMTIGSSDDAWGRLVAALPCRTATDGITQDTAPCPLTGCREIAHCGANKQHGHLCHPYEHFICDVFLRTQPVKPIGPHPTHLRPFGEEGGGSPKIGTTYPCPSTTCP